jgi:hypothetical protein
MTFHASVLLLLSLHDDLSAPIGFLSNDGRSLNGISVSEISIRLPILINYRHPNYLNYPRSVALNRSR